MNYSLEIVSGEIGFYFCQKAKMEEARADYGVDLFVEFKPGVKDDAQVFDMGADVGGKGANGVRGGCKEIGVKINDVSFVFIES